MCQRWGCGEGKNQGGGDDKFERFHAAILILN
jgi:hypothetical protein